MIRPFDKSHLWTKNFSFGLTPEMLEASVKDAYEVLETIDEQLISKYQLRFAEIAELANLSSIIGNLVALGIVQHSDGVFGKAGPHKYQDLRTTGKNPKAANIEIKMALEKNKPKGHLPKAGTYLVLRYVLMHPDGSYSTKERGSVPRFWEIRLGELEESDFATSNTPGDSGKTANVTAESIKKLKIVYFDPMICPYPFPKDYLLKTS